MSDTYSVVVGGVRLTFQPPAQSGTGRRELVAHEVVDSDAFALWAVRAGALENWLDALVEEGDA